MSSPLPWKTRLRQATVDKIIAAATNAEGRVYNARVLDFEPGECPAITVITPTDEGDGDGIARPQFSMRTSVRIEMTVLDPDPVARDVTGKWNEDLDILEEQVKEAILCDPKFLGEWGRPVNVSSEVAYAATGEHKFTSVYLTLTFASEAVFKPVSTAAPLQSIALAVSTDGPFADENKPADDPVNVAEAEAGAIQDL